MMTPRVVSSQTTNREPETEPTYNYSPVWIADPKRAVSYAAAGQILSEQAEAPRVSERLAVACEQARCSRNMVNCNDRYLIQRRRVD